MIGVGKKQKYPFLGVFLWGERTRPPPTSSLQARLGAFLLFLYSFTAVAPEETEGKKIDQNILE